MKRAANHPFSLVHLWVENTVNQSPEAIAVSDGSRSLNYRELNEQANQLAHALLQIPGVKQGMVGICLDRSPELMIAILAVLKAGAAYVPFDVEYPAERLQYMAETSSIPVMISSDALAKRLPAGSFRIFNLQDESSWKLGPTNNPALDFSDQQPAYVLFTSGSTGQPKGVVMPHKALSNLIDWQLQETAVHSQGKTVQFAPVSFDVHFQEIFSTWADGGCLCLINDEMRLNPLLLTEYLAKHRINRLYLPFIALQNLAELAQDSKHDLSALKEIITAGEQLQVTPALIRFFEKLPHCRFFNHYGPTEAHVVSSFPLTGAPNTWAKLPPIGKEIQHTSLYILNEKGEQVAPGTEGELFIAGDCLALGYLNREDLTKERFISNPFVQGTKMYRTGDLARREADGNIQYLGRIDGQVKVRGYRIELGEIEVVLSRFPEVTAVAVTVREDKPGEKKLVAYLVMQAGAAFQLKKIRGFLQAQLPDYMMPSAFVQLDALPRTPSGKIDRRQLPAPDQKRPDLGVPFAAAENTTQRMLVALWERLLNITPIGIQDNFFDLGGNSLLALQSIALLKQEQGLDLSVVKLYQQPTISGLSRILDGQENIVSLRDQMQERAAARNSGQKNDPDQAIAIVGMSLRFPGADSPEQFWNNITNGVESISFFKPEELDPFIPHEERQDPHYVPVRGIMSDAAGFDAAFFNMNPNVAKVTDPQHRHFLELSWNALEHAGYAASRYDGLVGVFAGTGNNTYYLKNVLSNPTLVNRVGQFLTMTQNEKDYIATRVAYELNLKGLAVSVHTGCSTSLTAIVQGCDALWNRQCDMALAGGVAITSPVNSGHVYEEGAMFSNDGRTRTFDADARGTVFSDGAAVVVLKRYADALADGDTVYALIRGAALNNDGGDKGSFTAPSVEGQAAAISMAQAMAGVDPRSISYVEAHGTATPLGDPIEVEGLTRAFSEYTSDKQFCALGSVKTNIGHLTAAAGVAGLIKTALALYHKQIPGNLHYSKPNPQIAFENTPFFVADRLRPWNTDHLPRRAGVSSFGVGGTNAHVVLEEAPTRMPSGPARSKQLLLLSAKTPTALQLRVQELKEHIEKHPAQSTADLAFTLQTGRHAFHHRFFAVADNNTDALSQLTQPDARRSARNELKKQAGSVCFMFPGQGSQYAGMGANLYRDEMVFREAVDRCASILEPLLGRDLRPVLFATEGEEASETLLKQTFYTQPALFTIGYSLAQLWQSWGIRPAALIGHSIGEFVAATLAGVFSLEDALYIVATRGRMMQDLPGGAMLSVRLPAADVEKRIHATLSIAAINGPQLCVVAGPTEAIQQLQQQLEKEEIVCKALFTSHAFHSPMMDPIVKPFEEAVRKVKLHAPKIPILSTVTTSWLSDEEATDPLYWAKHLRATVRFADGVKSLWTLMPEAIMLELGPRNTASTLARQQAIDPKTQKAIPSLGDHSRDDAEWTALLSAIGSLWLQGIEIDWNAFYALEKRQRMALPGYPFEHQRFWLDPPQLASLPQQFPAFPESMLPTMPMMPMPAQEITTTTTSSTNTTMPSRKDRLISELSELLEEASGIEMSHADPSASFVELGLDSLFLTSIALSISKKYGVKITFRQLNEDLSSLNGLSDHLDRQMPADVVSAAPSATPAGNPAMANPAAMNPAQMPPNGNMNPMQWMYMQQMQMMQQMQLMMMGQQGAPVTMPAAMPASPAAPPQSAAAEGISADELKELKKPFGAIARIEKIAAGDFNEKQTRWMKAFTEAFVAKTKKSKDYTQAHRAHLADPRVVTGFKPHLKELIYQPVVNRSLGSRVWDIDGNEYVDILNGFGSNMFGHNPEFIVKALAEQLQRGYELGPQHELAGEVAALICEMIGADRAGLCNTGSEAVLGAMRIARTVTGRNLIVSFNGSYHGINDEVILRGTKKLKSIPASAGIPPEAVQNMLVLDYGTPEALAIIKQRGDEIAAVLVEPVQSRRADFQPREFLHNLRKLTEETGSLLIFDEVITGFRTMPGGAQQYFGVQADVATYGKVVGGGMPIGVIAGKKAYMDALDGGFWQYGDDSVPEAGVTYFAGTFVRHPFALAAAKASLLHLKEMNGVLQETLNANTGWLAQEVNQFCDASGIPFRLVHFGSLFKPKYDPELPNTELIYLLLRHKGIHVYQGFPCFLTEAHTRNDLSFIVSAFKEVLTELVEFGFLPGEVPAQAKLSKSEAPFDTTHPPVAGAQLGKNPDGTPGWFVPDPKKPGNFMRVNLN